jgi:hypothetical protein
VNDFWTTRVAGFYEVSPDSNGMIDLITLSVASADAEEEDP